MLQYLVRYEVARLLFSRAGAVLLMILVLVFGSTIGWLIQHWWLTVLGLAILSAAKSAFRTGRR